MRLYETGFLIAPNITEEEAEGLVQQMADVVSQKSGKMIRIEKWGKRRTAYTMKKFNEAYLRLLPLRGRARISRPSWGGASGRWTPSSAT